MLIHVRSGIDQLLDKIQGTLGQENERLHSRKLTWKPKKGPIKTTVLMKGDYMGFHVSLGEISATDNAL